MKTKTNKLKFLSVLMCSVLLFVAGLMLGVFLENKEEPLFAYADTYPTVYLDPTDGSDSNTGLSKAEAFSTLQKAINSTPTTGKIIVCNTIEINSDTTIDFGGRILERYYVTYDTDMFKGDIFKLGTWDESLTDEENIANMITVSFYNFTIDGKDETKTHDVGGRLINGENSILTLDGATLKNNPTNVAGGKSGGAVYCAGSLTIFNCVFKNNSSISHGGAVYAGDSATVDNCEFYDNSALGSEAMGGALYVNKNLTVSNSLFNGNSAVNNGGAICAPSTEISDVFSMVNCRFVGNHSGYIGGAVEIGGMHIEKFDNCSFINNNAVTYGGAVRTSNLTNAKVTNSYFENNRVTYHPYGYGGALFFASSATNTVEDCVFINNSTVGYGGAVCSFAGTLNCIDSRFINNKAPNCSAVYARYYLNLTNCTFTGHCKGYDDVTGDPIGSNYVVYAGASATIKGCVFKDNVSSNYGVVKVSGTSTRVVDGTTYYLMALNGITLTIEDSLFENNVAGLFGGAVYSSAATTKIKNTSFYNNSSNGPGGAIMWVGTRSNASGTLTVSGCNFLGNSANTNATYKIFADLYDGVSDEDIVAGSINLGSAGGAICAIGGNVNVDDCIFGGWRDSNNNCVWNDGETSFGNSAYSAGGAIYISDGATGYNITNCKFSKNESTKSSGGAICIESQSVEFTGNITDCDFSYNTAYLYGGALHLSGSYHLSIMYAVLVSNCNFTYNKTTINEGRGGAAYVTNMPGDRCSFVDCYFAYNSSYIGGAINSSGGYLRVSNITVENNTAQVGGGIYADSHLHMYNDIIVRKNTATVRGGGIAFYAGWSHVLYGNYAYIYDNTIDGEQNNCDYPANNGNIIKSAFGFVNPLNAGSKIGIYLADSYCEKVLTTANGEYSIAYHNTYGHLLPEVVLDRTSYTQGNVTYNIETYDYLAGSSWYKYVKFVNPANTSAIEYTVNSYMDYYDSQPHGLDVKVFNTTNYTITYSLKDFSDASFNDETDALTQNPTFIDGANSATTVYVKISAPGFNDVFASGIVFVKKQAITFVSNNATLEGISFGQTIGTTTELNSYLKGFRAIDIKGNDIAGKFTLDTSYTPTVMNHDISDIVIRFTPYNPNYQAKTMTISTNITPKFSIREVYYKNGQFYSSKGNADAGTSGFGTGDSALLHKLLPHLAPVATIYFLTTYVVDSNQTITLKTQNLILSGYAQSSNIVTSSLISISEGKTLTFDVTALDAKLTIQGGLALVSATNYNSLLVNAGTLNISGNVEIRDSNSKTATTNANGAGIVSSGTLKLSGIYFYNLTGLNGGAIAITDGTANITNCLIHSNKADYGGALHNEGTLNLTDCILRSNSATYDGGGVYCNQDTNVTNCTFDSNTSQNGGGLYVNTSVTLTISDCYFRYNKGTPSGGAIYVAGTANIKNCNFWANSATNGGGIYNAGTLTLDDCVINGCTATSGKSIYSSTSFSTADSYLGEEINLSGENIVVDLTNVEAEIIVIPAATTGSLNLKGRIIVSTYLNYYFYDGGSYKFKVCDNGLNTLSKIILNPQNSSKTAGLIAVYSEYFSNYYSCFALYSAISGLILSRTSGGYLGLVSSSSVSAIDGNIVFFDPVSGNNSNNGLTISTPIKTFGKLQEFLSDVTFSKVCFVNTLTIDNAFVNTYGNTISFNNFYLTRYTSFSNNMFNITYTSGFNITDIRINGLVSGSNYTTDITRINVTANCSLVISNIDARNCKSYSIYMTNGSATINNGTFVNNVTSSSGAAIQSTTVLTLNNCYFEGNSSTNNSGGAVYTSSGTTRINDCVFRNNSSKNYGGAVYSSNSMTANNCKFINNKTDKSTTYYGGAVYVGSTCSLTNCIFEFNTAGYYAGAVYGSTVTATNCTFKNNKSTYSGGAIYTNSSNTMRLTNCTFDNNTSIYYGGAIFTQAYTITITNCEFTNNKLSQNSSSYYGGAIYCSNSNSTATCTVTNSRFDFNVTYGHGGAIFSYCGNNTITNCQFSNNRSNSYGGAVYSNYSVTFKDCTFKNNFSSSYGGAIYGSSLTIINCQFINNRSGYGGAIYGSSSTIRSCVFNNNSVSNSGGAVYVSGTSYIESCSFTNCNTTSSSGNAGALYGASAIIANNCIFADNVCRNGHGGAVYSYSFYAYACTFINNYARNGNGGAFSGSLTKAVNCVFLNNTSYSQGGAVYNQNYAMTLDRCRFEGNLSINSHGGAIYADTNITASNSSFVKNKILSSSYHGGAIYSSRNVTLTNCDVSYNTSAYYGGAVYCYNSGYTLTVKNSTICGNTAKSNGGAFYAYNAVISDSKLLDNYSPVELIYANNSLSITNGMISGNYGGRELFNSYFITVKNSTIANNKFELGIIYSYISSNISNKTKFVFDNCKIYGNVVLYEGSSYGYSLIAIGTYVDGSNESLIKNCDFYNNKGLNNTSPWYVIRNYGGNLIVSGCRFANNLAYNGTGYDFVGICASGGKTAIEGCDFSYNLKDDLGENHIVSTNGLVNFASSIKEVYIDESTFTNNNFSANGAVVSTTDKTITIANTVFENNTGKITNLKNADLFNVVLSNNDFENQSGIELTGKYNLFNCIFESNTSGSGSALATSGTGLIENLVADGNTATEGAVIKNSGFLTIDSNNTLFGKFAKFIVGHDIVFYPQTLITNNTAVRGGAIINTGDLCLLGGAIGENGNGNKANLGGGVYNALGGNLIVDGAIIGYNTAETPENNDSAPLGNGGGVYNLGTMVMSSGTIRNNVAQNGGGIYNLGSLTINGGEISYNTLGSVGNGAGICNVVETLDTNNDNELDTTFTGSLVVNGGNISFNVLPSQGKGGGIYNSGYMVFNDGVVEDNGPNLSASGFGGAIFASGVNNYVNGGKFLANRAEFGGAFFIDYSSTLNITNTYITIAVGYMKTYGNIKGYINCYGGTENSYTTLNFSNSYVTSVNPAYDLYTYFIQNGYDSEQNYIYTSVNNITFENMRIISVFKINRSVLSAQTKIENCVFKNNTVITGNSDCLISSIYSGQRGSTFVKNCVFDNNNYKSIVYVNTFVVEIERCKFINNKCVEHIILQAYNLNIADCLFENNIVSDAGNLIWSYYSGFVANFNLSNSIIRNNIGCVLSVNNKLSLLGDNIIQNNYSTGVNAGIVLGQLTSSNTTPLILGYGGKLVISNNRLLTAGSATTHDLAVDGNYYRFSTECNLSLPKGLSIISGGLQQGSNVGLTFTDAELEDVLFSSKDGYNISATDFSAFYLDNANLGRLLLTNNQVVLKETAPYLTVYVSDKTFVVDGFYHGLTDADFTVFNATRVLLENSESLTQFVVKYSLTEDGEYGLSSPQFVNLGEYDVYYKVFNSSNVLLDGGSVKIKIVKKTLSLIEAPKALISKGVELSNANFIGGRVVDNFGNVVSGVWSFVNSTTVPTSTTTAYTLNFSPYSANAYSNSVSTSAKVTYKFDKVTYKTMGETTGFYVGSVYTGFNKLSEISSYISKDGIIELEQTYVFETSESVIFNENVHINWLTDSTAFQVGSEANINVGFAGNGKVFITEKTISTNAYIFNILANMKLTLVNLVVGNMVKTFASSSIPSLIYNLGVLDISGAEFVYNTIKINSGTNAYGGIIYNKGTINFNAGNFANNTLNNLYNGKAYGGVVYNNGGVLNFNNGTFSINKAYGIDGSFGGVIYNTNSGSIRFNNSVFSGNNADYGGVIANDSGTVVFNDGTMRFNSASISGDVLYVNSQGSSTVYYNGVLANASTIANLNALNSVQEDARAIKSNDLNIVIFSLTFGLLCMGLLFIARFYKFKSKSKRLK